MNIYSKKEMEILSFLARRPLTKMYCREIAKALSISLGRTSQILKKLTKRNLLKTEKKGRMIFYSANMSNPEIKEFKVYINVLELNPLIQKIKDYSDKIILYGSCAEGTDTEKSDIDLFILTGEKEKVMNEIRKFKIDRKIVPVIMDSMEFIRIKQKDKAFYDQISRGKELWRRLLEL